MALGRRARKRQCDRHSKQYRRSSKQRYALHEPVPRLALIESVYQSNQELSGIASPQLQFGS